MKNFTSRIGFRIAVLAGAMSVVSAGLIPQGYVWPSVGWALVACAAAIWVAMGTRLPTRSMRDIISDVEAEPVLATVALKRRAPTTRVVL